MRTSQAYTERVLEKSNNDREQAVQLAFQDIYDRAPTAAEAEIAKKSMASESDPKEGLRLFIQAMFGANSFLYSY
jgi:hypothetical protein